jgi:hypothetical protein
MKQQHRTERKYVPYKINRLIQATERMQKLQMAVEDLSEDVTLDIIDGWSTGDELLDFALVACNGTYDPFVISLQYRRLFDLGLRKPNQLVLVTQKATYHYGEEEPLFLRNIHLACLRPEKMRVDIDSFAMFLPVVPGHLVWSEFYSEDGLIVSGYKVLDDEWLTTGPLYNEYCDFGHTREADVGVFYVPEDATCNVDLLPEADPSLLLSEHGIDQETLNYLRQIWIIELSGKS